MFAGQLALSIAALFTGAAVYISSLLVGVEAGLSARLHDAGEPRHRRRPLRGRCLLQHLRVALAARSRRPAGKLALLDLRDHSDLPPHDEPATGRRYGRNAPHDCAVRHSSRSSMRSWARGNPYLPLVFESRVASGDVRNVILP